MSFVAFIGQDSRTTDESPLFDVRSSVTFPKPIRTNKYFVDVFRSICRRPPSTCKLYLSMNYYDLRAKTRHMVANYRIDNANYVTITVATGRRLTIDTRLLLLFIPSHPCCLIDELELSLRSREQVNNVQYTSTIKQ